MACSSFTSVVHFEAMSASFQLLFPLGSCHAPSDRRFVVLQQQPRTLSLSVQGPVSLESRLLWTTWKLWVFTVKLRKSWLLPLSSARTPRYTPASSSSHLPFLAHFTLTVPCFPAPSPQRLFLPFLCNHLVINSPSSLMANLCHMWVLKPSWL